MNKTLDHGAPYILTRPEILTASECAEMRRKIDTSKLTVATINTPGGARLNTGIRNNERFMEDDHELATTSRGAGRSLAWSPRSP